MAKKEFNLTEIKKGDNIAWYVCTQTASNPVMVKLFDDSGKIYFSSSKQNGSTNLQVLNQGHDDIVGDNLILSIDIPSSVQIKQSITANNVTDSVANKIGQVYAFCVEDWIDEDYNDVYINIVGWSKKG